MVGKNVDAGMGLANAFVFGIQAKQRITKIGGDQPDKESGH